MQTAQRAEVMAVLKGLEAVKQCVLIVSDSKYVVDTLSKTKEEVLKCGAIHGDLWEAIWLHRDRIRGAVWIKAHQDREQALLGGWSEEDWYGTIVLISSLLQGWVCIRAGMKMFACSPDKVSFSKVSAAFVEEVPAAIHQATYALGRGVPRR